MTAPPRTTVKYRVLVEPDVGPTLGNTVHVGMDVEYGNQIADLVFEGLPRRIDQVRDMLDLSIARFGYRFSTRERTTALDLRAAMESDTMQRFAPQLVTGADIFEREQPR